MIYISSACSRKDKIGDAIEELVAKGFKNVELTGGTKYYEEYEYDVLRLKEKYDLNYVIHNYFPPPQEDFVLNLASLDDDIYQRSLRNLQKSIELSKKIEATKFGFHVGFFVDINVGELGKKFRKQCIKNRKFSIKRFCDGFAKLKQESDGIDLYLENNAYSYSNYKVYKDQIPLMLLNFSDYADLKNIIDFKLLLDLAHLNVSINSLNLNSDPEFNNMINSSDYIHISNNNGLHDQNNGLSKVSFIDKILRKYDLKEKTITLEIYDDIDTVIQSYNFLSSTIVRV